MPIRCFFRFSLAPFRTSLPWQLYPHLARNLSSQLLSPRKPPLKMLSTNSTIRGESGAIYRLVNPLGHSGRGTTATSNVWKVVRESDERRPEFVAKSPSREDDEPRNWPAFQHEAKMQRLFVEDPMLRRMVDFVPKTEKTPQPVMILEPFQKPLWDARTTRSFSTREIKWIMRGVLLGIMTVHRKGLVYTGLPSRPHVHLHVADETQILRWRTLASAASITRNATTTPVRLL